MPLRLSAIAALGWLGGQEQARRMGPLASANAARTIPLSLSPARPNEVFD